MLQYVPTAVLAQLSFAILVKISFTGTVRKKIGSLKRKKIGVLAIQKVAKTDNIGKKSSGRRYRLCKIPQHAED